MENRFLIDLAVKYGLGDEQVSKVVNMCYQAGQQDINSDKFQRIAKYICAASLVNVPDEEVIEELRRKGFM